MKACKKGLERAYSHGQHILDKRDPDIQHAAIDNTLWTSMTITHSMIVLGECWPKNVDVDELYWCLVFWLYPINIKILKKLNSLKTKHKFKSSEIY